MCIFVSCTVTNLLSFSLRSLSLTLSLFLSHPSISPSTHMAFPPRVKHPQMMCQGSFLCCDCLPDEKEDTSTGGGEDDEEKGKWRMSSNNDEEERVTYSYSFFHFLMIISVMYLMMQLTNWAE